MKFNLNCLLIFVVFSLTIVSGKELPDSFVKCKRSDPKLKHCLKDSISSAIKLLKDGLPEFGISSINPLKVNALSIDQGKNSPISLRQDYKNIQILHLTDSVITKYSPDLEHFRMKCEGFTPKLEFLADYIMDGRILVLPITGKGRSNITMLDLTTKHELIGESITKNNEVYMKLKEYRIKFQPKNVKLHFENLFNGDKILADNMNRFLNENWELVFNELKGGYEETFGLVFKDITNKLFTKVPMRKIFLE